MRVVGFIGPSGSGKSYRAAWVAKERLLDFLIDDGLLIRGTRIVAGTSAKKEPTKIGSVKCALFSNDSHCRDVRIAIELYKPEGILILGTSDNMVNNIASRLQLPPLHEKVYIHEIATPSEIQHALTVRREQGKHVIPVPTLEIRKHFSGYFLDPLQILKRKSPGSYQFIGEKSVVRPTFSYMGKYIISDYTIYQIAEHSALLVPGVAKISRFRAENHPEGVLIEVDLVLKFGYNIRALLIDVQNKICIDIEKLTALNILSLDVVAKSLVVESEK